MGKVLIAVGAIATLAVGTLAADQATSQEYKSWWMVGHADDTPHAEKRRERDGRGVRIRIYFCTRRSLSAGVAPRTRYKHYPGQLSRSK